MKADKQDGGHCLACQKKMIKYGVDLGDWKTAETAAQEMVTEAQGERPMALAHYQFGYVLLQEEIIKRKDELFAHAHEELTKALEAIPHFPAALFADGQALAHLKQDDAAKAQFEQFVKMRPEDSPDRQRALRYISQPELARGQNGAPVCRGHDEWTTGCARRSERESGADRLPGDMVRALPRSPAAGEEHRKEVRGAAAGSAEREPR